MGESSLGWPDTGTQPQTAIGEKPAQFENGIKPWVYVRRITRSTMYKKAPFC